MTELLEPESVTELVTKLTYRLAQPIDLAAVISLFGEMLVELEPLGHDILPTPRNIVTFADYVFAPALESDQHGVVLAVVGHDVIGASFFTPEPLHLDTPGKRAMAHGIYVHPTYRGQSIARKLQAIAHARLQDLGFTDLISMVVVANQAGLASAKAGGATITGYMTSVSLKGDS